MTHDPIAFARQNIKYHTDRDWPTLDQLGRVNFVLRGNGLWEVRKNGIGTFFYHRHDSKIPGFPEETMDSTHVELAIPKIPRRILNQIIAFFKKLTEEHDFEAYVQIVWDKENQEHVIVCPEQVVSKGRVKYEATNVSPERFVLVCDIHSHNSMLAFFSGVDDSDEKKRGDRFFGVVGKLDSDLPQFKLSFILGGGERVYVDAGVLFEEETFPTEWLEKVSYADKLPNNELVRAFEEFKDSDSAEDEALESDEDLEDLDEEPSEDVTEHFSRRSGGYSDDDLFRHEQFNRVARGDGIRQAQDEFEFESNDVDDVSWTPDYRRAGNDS
jgi:PRTRC genetic system protein A